MKSISHFRKAILSIASKSSIPLFRWTGFLVRRTIWQIESKTSSRSGAATRKLQRIHKNIAATMQFVIHLPILPAILQPVGSDTEANEHEQQNQPVPELQPPLDGLENHHRKNIQRSTFNIEHSPHPHEQTIGATEG
jgi:hypothetical protein